MVYQLLEPLFRQLFREVKVPKIYRETFLILILSSRSGRNFSVARTVDIDQDPSYWSGSTTLIRMILTCTCRGTAGWSWPSPWPSPASGNTVNKHYIVFFMTLFQRLILKQYFVLHRSNVSNLHILWCELRIHVRLRLHFDPDPRGLVMRQETFSNWI